MIIDAYATDTTPSYEVRRRALEALTNEGEPMQEVTYDALYKRLAAAADEIEKLRAENAKLAASNHAYLSNYQEALAEIERLRAGGCARDQTTTQYCAEAVRLQDAINDLAKHIWRGDWDKLKPETRELLGEKEMSDIADKIYAATGLTLGAEEAAKIGQMIQAENEKLRARAVKWAGIAGTLIAERDQLIGVLQIAVERSGDMETPPAWVDGACSLLNRGFLKVDRTALGEKDDAKV